MKLKICGMRDSDNILEVALLRPDFMGFIFYPKSPRYVGEDFVIPALPLEIKRVGVFVNESADQMVSAVRKFKLDYLQLHGNESVETCRELKKEGVSVIKVFSIDDDFDFTETKDYEDVVDFFLFDTKGKYYGGNSRPFNWDRLSNYNQKVPFFLSGGLSPENVGEMKKLEGMNLFALDVNSGVESKPGMKNVMRIEELILKLKN